MSGNDTQLVLDQTDLGRTSSNEAVMILAVVLGFFLTIMICLCVLRYRVSEKIGVVATRSLSSDPRYREQTSNTSWHTRWNKSASPVAGELITHDEEQTNYRKDQSIVNDNRYQRYAPNDSVPKVSKAHSYPMPGNRAGRVSHPARPPEKRRRRPTFSKPLDYAGHRTSEVIPETSSISHREETLLEQYDEQYDKSTRCAGEATDDFTSLEEMEESDVTEEDNQDIFETPITQLSSKPDERGPLNYKGNHSIITSPSIREISLSAVPLHDSDNHAQPNTWHLLANDIDNDSTRSTQYYNPNDKPDRLMHMRPVIERRIPNDRSSIATSYSTSEPTSVRRKNIFLIDQRNTTAESGYLSSQTEQKRKHPGGIMIPHSSAENQGTVDVAVETPFIDSEESTTDNDKGERRVERLPIACRPSGESRFDSVAIAGRTDFPEIWANNRSSLRNIESKRRTPDGEDITRGYITSSPDYEITRKIKHAGLGPGEASPLIQPELRNLPSSSCMGTEKFDTIPSYPRNKRDNENSLEIHQTVARW